MQNHKSYQGLLIILCVATMLLSSCTPQNAAEVAESTATPITPEQDQPTEPEMTPTVEPAERDIVSPTSPIVFEPWVQLELIASGLTAPVAMAAPKDESGRRFIVDQTGLIYVLDSQNQLIDRPFLDVRDRMVRLNTNYDERGLLGMAFHPDYAENGRFFLYYSAPLRPGAPSGWDHTSIVSEFRVSQTDPNQADPDSETIIMAIDQPQENHNAGSIVFGPDGTLFIPLGDGGSAHDIGTGHVGDWYAVNQGGNGQDVEENMLGSILRIDIDNGNPYAVPTDNPEISENFPEIWAYGFRNPYRIAFDPGGDHELFVGDAGQSLWEEVSIVEAGGNYGWNVLEGAHCFSTADPRNPNAITECPGMDSLGNPLIDPIIEFRNSSHPDGGLGTSIVGGVVYRGELLPAWDGRYIFGQWSTSFRSPVGGLFVATKSEDDSWTFESIQIINFPDGDLGEYLLALGQDAEGEVYVLTSSSTGPNGNTGKVYRLRSATE
jgi:glucose/arabinose dehydrogenase